MATSVFERNLSTLLSRAFFPGFPVPIETKHLTKGFKSPVSGHQRFEASPSTSSTGLFAEGEPARSFGKNFFHQLTVNCDTLIRIHLKSAEHDSNEAGEIS